MAAPSRRSKWPVLNPAPGVTRRSLPVNTKLTGCPEMGPTPVKKLYNRMYNSHLESIRHTRFLLRKQGIAKIP